MTTNYVRFSLHIFYKFFSFWEEQDLPIFGLRGHKLIRLGKQISTQYPKQISIMKRNFELDLVL